MLEFHTVFEGESPDKDALYGQAEHNVSTDEPEDKSERQPSVHVTAQAEEEKRFARLEARANLHRVSMLFHKMTH